MPLFWNVPNVKTDRVQKKHDVEELYLINEWSQLERNVTKNYEFI